MATGQYHHALQCVTFADDRGKVRQAKIAKLEFKFWEAIARFSEEKVFWKYTGNLRENTHVDVWFQ